MMAMIRKIMMMPMITMMPMIGMKMVLLEIINSRCHAMTMTKTTTTRMMTTV